MRSARIPVDALLAGLPLFSSLDGDAVRRLANNASQLQAERGTLVFHPATPCVGLYAVVDGRIKISRGMREGAERVIEIAEPGDPLSVECLFRDRAYGATAVTLEDAYVVHIAKPAFIAELERSTGFARTVIEALSGRVANAVEDLECCTLHSARERVAGFLLRRMTATANGRSASLTLPAGKGVVASHLNLTHEHFSRVLRQLSEEGLIRVEGRDIAIADVSKLRATTA